MSLAKSPEYRVEPAGETFAVRDGANQVVCVVGDRPQAEHYAVLLEHAFMRGRKLGYRLAKRGESLPD